MLKNLIYQGDVAHPILLKTGEPQAYCVTQEANGYAVWALIVNAEEKKLEQQFLNFQPEPCKYDAIDIAVRNIARMRLDRKLAERKAEDETLTPLSPEEGPLSPEADEARIDALGPQNDAERVTLGERILAFEGGPEVELELTPEGEPICPECRRRIGGHFKTCSKYVEEPTMGTIGRASLPPGSPA